MKLDKDTLQPVVLAHRVSDSSPTAPGSEIIYANDPDIARDRTIYFTASVDIYPPRHADGYWDTARGWMLGMLRVGLACLRCAATWTQCYRASDYIPELG